MALAMAAIGGQDVHLADAFRPVRMHRVRHLNQDGVDHRQVRGDRAAIVQEPGVIEQAFGVVDIFFVQRPADALHDTALDLAPRRNSDGIALAGHPARQRISGCPHGSVSGSTSTSTKCAPKPGALRARVDTPSSRRVIGPPVAAALPPSSASDIGLKLAHVGACYRPREPVFPDDAFRVDIPDHRRAPDRVLDDIPGRIDHRHAGGKGHPRAAGHVRVAD